MRALKISVMILPILIAFSQSLIPPEVVYQAIFEKKFLTLSAEEFATWYARHADNIAEAEELAKVLYYRKLVEWAGIVSAVQVVDGITRYQWLIKTQAERQARNPNSPPSYYEIPTYAAFKDKEDIFQLRKGNTLRVRCTLSSVQWAFPAPAIMLDGCQLLEVKP